MRTTIKTLTAAAVAGVIIAGSMLDSTNPLPLIVCGVCMAWLGLYSMVRWAHESI